ncbi:MAG TPA: ribosome small subunit-dependent GTPase A [Planctomycetaceae bacterium]|nr:ribosome small subunit-dependent GTPase A [Planctomycetaceae bacterium]
MRIAFRKNRQRRARLGDVTRKVRKEDDQTVDLPSVERISGKGDLTRHRTILADDQDAGAGALRAVDEVNCRTGRVLSASGLNCIVSDAAGGRLYECTVRRVVRTMSRDQRGAVVAGDSVVFQAIDREHGVIERINPRRTVLARSIKGKEQLIAANISQALILVSAANPALKTNLVDRLLISAHKGGAKPIICINKCDLVDPVRLQPIVGTYARLGYEILLTSATAQIGIDELKHMLRGQETVAAGQSGVGKSSLLNALQPGLRLETGTVSDWSQKGRHTTRTAVLHPLDFGGWVVDTPGIRQLSCGQCAPRKWRAFSRSSGPSCRAVVFRTARTSTKRDARLSVPSITT